MSILDVSARGERDARLRFRGRARSSAPSVRGSGEGVVSGLRGLRPVRGGAGHVCSTRIAGDAARRGTLWSRRFGRLDGEIIPA
jgi:hypothetical protein